MSFVTVYKLELIHLEQLNMCKELNTGVGLTNKFIKLNPKLTNWGIYIPLVFLNDNMDVSKVRQSWTTQVELYKNAIDSTFPG